MNFSDTLKRYRDRHRMSQEELAQRLFVSVGTINRWETGKREPNHNMRRRILAIINGGGDDNNPYGGGLWRK